MAREYIFIEEIRNTTPVTYELIQSTQADVVIDTFIQILREIFQSHPIYTYVPRSDSQGPDFALTKICIVDKYQEEALLLPIITSSFNNANTQWIQFSQSPFNTVLKPQFNPDGSIKRDNRGRMVPSHYEYVGAYNGSLTLLISASDTLEREELCNLVHVFLTEELRDELMVRGVFVRNVTTGGQTEVPYRNDYIFQAPITVDFYSEWRRLVPVGDTLLSIGLDVDLAGPGYSEVSTLKTTAMDQEFVGIIKIY